MKLCSLSTVWGHAQALGATMTWRLKFWLRTAASWAVMWALIHAVDLRALRQCLSWTLEQTGKPSGGFQRPTAAVWGEERRGSSLVKTRNNSKNSRMDGDENLSELDLFWRLRWRAQLVYKKQHDRCRCYSCRTTNGMEPQLRRLKGATDCAFLSDRVDLMD